MYEELIKILYHLSESHKYEPFYPSDKLREAANAIEAQDKHILTLQHEMMAEAESHIALVERLNKQIEVLSKKEKTTELPKEET